ncbi:hypothetical protein [Bradyrhizobium sp. NAS96.2]|uniref:hypothetical protein n=1 Tax=Bradyrhizobium sp. NAS96.2 TaxID=1680160 RepID=UPI0032DF6701
MHKRAKVVYQGTAVVLRLGVAGHCLRKCIDRADVAVQGRRMECDGDWSFFECGQFGLDAQSFFLQFRDPLLGVLLGNYVIDHEINVALSLPFDPITFCF